MTKQELVTKIAKKTGLQKDEVLLIVEELMINVKESLAEGEPVFLRGFGSFIVKERARKTARNISKDTAVIIPAHNVPVFKPCKEFKGLLASGPTDK